MKKNISIIISILALVAVSILCALFVAKDLSLSELDLDTFVGVMGCYDWHLGYFCSRLANYQRFRD